MTKRKASQAVEHTSISMTVTPCICRSFFRDVNCQSRSIVNLQKLHLHTSSFRQWLPLIAVLLWPTLIPLPLHTLSLCYLVIIAALKSLEIHCQWIILLNIVIDSSSVICQSCATISLMCSPSVSSLFKITMSVLCCSEFPHISSSGLYYYPTDNP